MALAAAIAGGVMIATSLDAPDPEVPIPEFTCVVPEVKRAPDVIPPEPDQELTPEHAMCSCEIDGRFTTEQARTLELACRVYSDEQCRFPFELFATPKADGRTAVIVKRSTGDCGGCGALTIAAMFDHGKLEAIGELGRFGRFGNGPDAARLISVAGDPAIELAWSESMGGYTSEYRSLFTRDGDSFKDGACIETAWDDKGAHEHPTAWTADVRYADDGGIGVRYTLLTRGSAKPVLAPVTIGFDRKARTWIFDRPVESCLTPPRPDLIDI